MAVGRLLDRSAVVDELRRLASAPALASRREELETVADALVGNGDLDRWTELDLLQVFARPESVRAAVVAKPESRRWAALEIALGALVFVPLLVTWSGLMQATTAYQALIGTDPKQASRPFLQLWQSGFEGRLGGWATFGHVALYASLLIGLLLVLSVVHGVRRANVSRRETQAERLAEGVLADLVPLLTRVQLLLHEHRRSSPQRFVAELTSAAETLERLSDQAAQTHRALVKAAEAVEESAAAAEKRLAGVAALVKPLETAADRIGQAVRDSGEQVDKAVRDSGEQVDKAVRDSGEQVDKAVRHSGDLLDKAVRDSGEQVDKTLRHSSDLLEKAVRHSTGSAADATSAVRDATCRVGDELARGSERVEEAILELATAQRAFTTGTEVAADVTGQVASGLEQALERISGVTEQTARSVELSQEGARCFTEQAQALRSTAERFGELVLAATSWSSQVGGSESGPVVSADGTPDRARQHDARRGTAIEPSALFEYDEPSPAVDRAAQVPTARTEGARLRKGDQ
ncbi:hypothetical protein AB0K74_27110 [Streptomyces sp. NPDC056159]|uniref:hypothetical protein n=1 Tax=Streptomyces sp. NPDC056159 TaxID=3155537 RepID=UPI0034416A9F